MIIHVKKYLYATIFSLLLLLLLFPFLHSGIYQSHDGLNHIARIAAYFQALRDGQFPPRWAGNLNFTYGNPVFIFFYPLPTFLAAGLHFFGTSFEKSYLIIILLSFLFCFMTFFLWSRTYLKKEQAIAASILYGLTPYHLLDLYVRGDIGELMAFAILPLIFYALHTIVFQKKTAAAVWGGALLGLLILSHNGISLMFMPIILAYAIFLLSIKKSWRATALMFSMFILGFSLSAFFWIPALEEKKYVQSDFYNRDTYKSNYISLAHIFYSSWGFGSDVNKPGGLAPQIGIFYAVLGLFSIFFEIKQRKRNPLWFFWLTIGLFGVFISTSSSSFLWEHIALLRIYQFPWRFIGLASFSSVMLITYLISSLNEWIIVCLCTLLVLTSIPFIKVNGYIHYNDLYYLKFPGTTYYHGEASTVWTAGDAGSSPKSPVAVIEGKGKIKDYKRKSQVHTYTISMQTNGKILDNTTYFPGWRVYIDNRFIPIEFQDINHRGLITFPISSGTHKERVIFKETMPRLISDAISVLSLGIITGLAFKFVILKRRYHE